MTGRRGVWTGDVERLKEWPQTAAGQREALLARVAGGEDVQLSLCLLQWFADPAIGSSSVVSRTMRTSEPRTSRMFFYVLEARPGRSVAIHKEATTPGARGFSRTRTTSRLSRSGTPYTVVTAAPRCAAVSGPEARYSSRWRFRGRAAPGAVPVSRRLGYGADGLLRSEAIQVGSRRPPSCRGHRPLATGTWVPANPGTRIGSRSASWGGAGKG